MRGELEKHYDPTQSLGELMDLQETIAPRLIELIKKLPREEQNILIARFGLTKDREPQTWHEIGKKLHRTGERARQRLQKTLRALTFSMQTDAAIRSFFDAFNQEILERLLQILPDITPDFFGQLSYRAPSTLLHQESKDHEHEPIINIPQAVFDELSAMLKEPFPYSLDTQKILQMRYQDQRTVSEIAQILNTEVDNVRQSLNSAVNFLANQIRRKPKSSIFSFFGGEIYSEQIRWLLEEFLGRSRAATALSKQKL